MDEQGPEYDTEAALRQACARGLESREIETFWDRITQKAKDVRKANNFRHTWNDAVIRRGLGNGA